VHIRRHFALAPLIKRGQEDVVRNCTRRCPNVVWFDSEEERWPGERVRTHRPSGFQGQLAVLGPADLRYTVTRQPPRSPRRGRAYWDVPDGRAPLRRDMLGTAASERRTVGFTPCGMAGRGAAAYRHSPIFKGSSLSHGRIELRLYKLPIAALRHIRVTSFRATPEGVTRTPC